MCIKSNLKNYDRLLNLELLLIVYGNKAINIYIKKSITPLYKIICKSSCIFLKKGS